MKSILVAIIVLASTLSANPRSETVEFALTNALGDYPRSGSWPTTVDYLFYDTLTYQGPQVTVLASAAVVTGDAGSGLLSCCLTWPCPDTVLWTMTAECWIKKIGDPGYGVENTWLGWTALEGGPFAISTELRRNGGFSILNSGDRIWVRYSLAPNGYVHVCSEITPGPTGHVLNGLLILDVEQIVHTESTSWGRIKALFGE